MTEALDLMLLGDERRPRKLMRAIEIIARDLHPAFDAQDWIEPGISKESCVLCALTVRDFLRRVGFVRATIAPVMLTIRAFDAAGKPGHSLGVGVPDGLPTTDVRWNGHMVVVVDGWLLDMTLHRMRRVQWPWLKGMIAAPLSTERYVQQGFLLLTACASTEPDGTRVEIAWFAQPNNQSWRGGPDTEEWRRLAVSQVLADRYSERAMARVSER